MTDIYTIPKTIDPFRSANLGTRLNGMLPVREMTRLLPDLASNQSEVTFELEFGFDKTISVPWVKGQLKTCLELRCQRCLKSFGYDIIADFLLGLSRNTKDTEFFPPRYDPLVLADGVLELKDLLEEELIINLPIVPRHPIELCQVANVLMEQQGNIDENPFSSISQLKTN